jgi:hypothetical protein
MASAALLEQARNEGWTDEHVVERVLGGETALYELLMRRHNQRVYRIARAILRDDAEAEMSCMMLMSGHTRIWLTLRVERNLSRG